MGEVVWRGDEIKGLARKAATQGLLGGVDVAKAASVPLVPRESGELRASAYTEVDPNTLIAIVGYDVPRDVKAIKQHEDLSYRHPNGGRAKFLEIPVKQTGNQAAGVLARAIRGVLS